MTVFFLRHGIAEERERWSGDELDRPLTDRGREFLREEAKEIERLDLGIEAVLASPLARAYQTAEIVATRLGLLDVMKKEDLLSPGFDSGRLAEILARRPHTASLLLVGHEPDFSRTIGAVIGGGRIRCKKGALVCLEIEDAAAPSGALVWSLPPVFLRRNGIQG